MMQINYITGYAGTGKSTELQKQLTKLEASKTIVLAPTHKALERIRLDNGILYKTIHSLLGWVPGINEMAENINQIDITHKKDKEIEHYMNIIIDEGGMVSEEMFLSIIAKIEEKFDYDEDKMKDIVITIYLDPYQLLPVKGAQMQTDPESTVNLTTQYRSEAKDIVTTYTRFVDYLRGENTSNLTILYSDNIKKFNIKDFKRGNRLLAYTNLAVGSWNKKIAHNLGIDSYMGQDVQLGNKLDIVLVEDFVEPTLDELIIWYYSGKLVMQNTQIYKKFLEPSLLALIKNAKFIVGSDTYIYPVLPGIYEANKKIKSAKLKALKNKSKFTDVYALGRAFIMDYTFASTVHKAQGSEFDTVFIDKEDIQKAIFNNYYITYARLMYVALSRAKRRLYI